MRNCKDNDIIERTLLTLPWMHCIMHTPVNTDDRQKLSNTCLWYRSARHNQKFNTLMSTGSSNSWERKEKNSYCNLFWASVVLIIPRRG
jgi:hypothetical protein